MINQKHNEQRYRRYQEDLELGSQIAEVLDMRVKEIFRTYKNAGEALAEVTDLVVSGTTSMVRNYCRLGPAGAISSNRIRVQLANTQKKLTRLATFYSLLGIQEDDPVVELTKEINPNFAYLLNDDDEQSSVVSFSGADLTDAQIKQ